MNPTLRMSIVFPNRAFISAFTLMETMAVIFIIVILAILIFPVVKSVRMQGNNAQCIANLKMLSVGTQAYSADNNGFLPITYSVDSEKGGSFQDGGGAWYWMLAPYVDVPRWDTIQTYLGPQKGKIAKPCVFTCPNHGKDEPQPIVFPSNKPVSYAPPNGISKIENAKSPTITTETGRIWNLRLLDVNQPSKKVWLTDSAYPNINSIGGTRLTATDSNGWARIAFSRHDGAGNVAYYDGHVERITYLSLITGNMNQNVSNLFDPFAEIK